MEYGDNVGHFSCKTMIATNGSYKSHIAVTISNKLVRSDELQGRFEIKGGFLWDFVENDTNTNMVPGSVFRTRIMAMNNQELVITNEEYGREVAYRRSEQ